MAAFPVLNTAFIGKNFIHPLTRKRSWGTDIVTYDSPIEQTNELYSFPVRAWGISYKLMSVAQRAKLIEIFDACRGRGRQIYFEDPIDYTSTCTWTQTAYTISAVSQTEDYFRITGQYASNFFIGYTFKVTGSTGNDGVYTVSDISQDATYTYLYVTVNIPSAVVNGTVLRMFFQLYKTYYAGEAYTFDEPKQDIQPSICVVTVAGSGKTEGANYTLTDTDGIIRFVSASTPTNGQSISVAFSFYYRVKFSTDTLEDACIPMSLYNPDAIWLLETKRPRSIYE